MRTEGLFGGFSWIFASKFHRDPWVGWKSMGNLAIFLDGMDMDGHCDLDGMDIWIYTVVMMII